MELRPTQDHQYPYKLEITMSNQPEPSLGTINQRLLSWDELDVKGAPHSIDLLRHFEEVTKYAYSNSTHTSIQHAPWGYGT